MPTYTKELSTNYDLKLEVSVASQSIPNNRTTFNLKLSIVKTGGSGYWSNDSSSWNIRSPSGTTLKSGTLSSYDFTSYSTKVLYDGTATLDHKDDGTFSQTFYGNLTASGDIGSGTASGKPSVATIPRATTPSVSGTFTSGEAKSISLPRASSSFTHDLTYKFGSATGTIATGAGTSASWTPPHTLLSQIPNATSGTGTITVVTKNGSTTIGSKKLSFTLNAASSQIPTVSSKSITDANLTIATNIGAFVQGLSILTPTVTGAGVQGSTISTAGIRFASGTLIPSGQAFAPGQAGTLAYDAVVVDSRGREGTQADTVQVLAWLPPTININTLNVWRVNGSGEPLPTGTAIKIRLDTSISSLIVGSQKNSMTVRVYTRPSGSNAAWTLRDTITPSGLTYGDDRAVPGTYPVNESFDVRIEVADKTGYNTVGGVVRGTIVETSLPTALVTLDLYGNSVGVGKMHERGTLDVGGDTYIDGDIFRRDTSVNSPGLIAPFAGSTAPTGWLLCDGQEVSRVAYAELFAVIGTVYGAGNGSTTFNVPNARGRALVGQAASGQFDTLGAEVGAETHTLTVLEMPSHNHGGSTGNTLPSADFATAAASTNPEGSARIVRASTTNQATRPIQGATHNHSISSQGGGEAHNIVQPSLVVNYIIST